MVNPFFMFATGIENSYPTINGGRTRIDQMAKCRHYELWRTDFDLVQELGIHFLRLFFDHAQALDWLSRDRAPRPAA